MLSNKAVHFTKAPLPVMLSTKAVQQLPSLRPPCAGPESQSTGVGGKGSSVHWEGCTMHSEVNGKWDHKKTRLKYYKFWNKKTA